MKIRVYNGVLEVLIGVCLEVGVGEKGWVFKFIGRGVYTDGDI